jgi:hypothetical protein
MMGALPDAAEHRPWLTDPMYGGMSPTAAEHSWRAARRRRMQEADFDDARHGQDGAGAAPSEAPPVDSFDAFGERPAAVDTADITVTENETEARYRYTENGFNAITPAAWKGTEPIKQKFLASARIPCGDLTIETGNGGSGKTEIAMHLLVNVTAGLGDWLGCTIENGVALFLSCEEPEHNIRDRVERICKHRGIDPHLLTDLHLVFPELDANVAGPRRQGRALDQGAPDGLARGVDQAA